MKTVIIMGLFGVIAAMFANASGYQINQFQWWLSCLPFWLLGTAINFYTNK